jgi:hypothetical protein
VWLFRVVLRQPIEQDHVKQRFMHLNATVIAYKSKLAKAVHEEAHSGTGCADHICQRLLRDRRDVGFRFTLLAEFRHQQKYPRQSFFTGIEELIDKICLDTHTADQEEFEEYFGEGWLIVHHADHFVSVNLERCAGIDSSSGRQM